MAAHDAPSPEHQFPLLALVALSLPYDDMAVPRGAWNHRVLTEVCRTLSLPPNSVQAVLPMVRVNPGRPSQPTSSGEAQADDAANSSMPDGSAASRENDDEEVRRQNLLVFAELIENSDGARYHMLQLILSTICVRVGGYDARARGVLHQLALTTSVRWSGRPGDRPRLSAAEDSLARVLLAQAQAIDGQRQRKDRWRVAKIGAATVGGGALLFVTGGLAAPALAAAITAAGVTGVAVTTVAASATAVATIFGVTGGARAGLAMSRRTAGITEFEIIRASHATLVEAEPQNEGSSHSSSGEVEAAKGQSDRPSTKTSLNQSTEPSADTSKGAEEPNALQAETGWSFTRLIKKNLTKQPVKTNNIDDHAPDSGGGSGGGGDSDTGGGGGGSSVVDSASGSEDTAAPPSLSLILCVSGWLTDQCDFERPWGIDSMGMTFKERLQRFYAVHNPPQQHKVNDILKTYSGNEELLCQRIMEKYGANPRDPLRPKVPQGSPTNGDVSVEKDDAETCSILSWLDAEQQKKKKKKKKNKIEKEESNGGSLREASEDGDGTASQVTSPADPKKLSLRERLELWEKGASPGDEGDIAEGDSETGPDEAQRIRDLLSAPSSDEEGGDAEIEPTSHLEQLQWRPNESEGSTGCAGSGDAPKVSDMQPSSPAETERSVEPGNFNPLLLHFPTAAENSSGSDQQTVDLAQDPAANADVVRELQERASRLGITPNGIVEPVESSSQIREASQTEPETNVPEFNDVWFWRSRFGSIEHYILRWESEVLLRLGTSVLELMESATSSAAQKIAAASATTSLAALATAVALPYYMIRAFDSLDAVWTLACERADLAGRLLAETLLERRHGRRPVTLIGFSMGARLIFSCLAALERVHASFLKEQAEAASSGATLSATEVVNTKASADDAGEMPSGKIEESPVAGLIEDVVLLGTPVSVDGKWDKARKVVSSRLVNCYSTHDWTLGVLYRTQRWSSSAAGICEVPSKGVENCDVSSLIKSHSDYSTNIPRILDLVCLKDDIITSESASASMSRVSK